VAGTSTSSALPSGGHGLVGLRERADLLGGTFEATATEDGGFLVRLEIPLVREDDIRIHPQR
jgi:signal transduction histidine kinase